MNEIKTLLWHLDNPAAEGRRLPLVRDLAPVSYTHLTLPTNREV